MFEIYAAGTSKALATVENTPEGRCYIRSIFRFGFRARRVA